MASDHDIIRNPPPCGESMPTRTIAVSPESPRADRLETAARVLEQGGIVALPTETFYGLAVDAFCVEAVARLNGLKGKESDTPILLLVADADQAADVADTTHPGFAALNRRFWPGPLTIVLPARENLPAVIHGGRGTVALRMSGLELPRALAARLGRPITGISANLTGTPPARTAAGVALAFPGSLDLILDGGHTPGGAPSTIIDLTREPPTVLREGALPSCTLDAFLTVQK